MPAAHLIVRDVGMVKLDESLITLDLEVSVASPPTPAHW
jgi:hypothetical protein